MWRKIICVGVCVLILAPISSAFEIHKNNESSDKISGITYNYNLKITNLINQVNESLLSYFLEGLLDCGPRYTGTKNCQKAANFINDEFKEMGLPVYKLYLFKLSRLKKRSKAKALFPIFRRTSLAAAGSSSRALTP